jgi:hypothetical protein
MVTLAGVPPVSANLSRQLGARLRVKRGLQPHPRLTAVREFDGRRKTSPVLLSWLRGRWHFPTFAHGYQSKLHHACVEEVGTLFTPLQNRLRVGLRDRFQLWAGYHAHPLINAGFLVRRANSRRPDEEPKHLEFLRVPGRSILGP